MTEKTPDTTFAQIRDDGSSEEIYVGHLAGTSQDVEDMQRMGKKQLFKRNFNFLSIFGLSMILMNTWEAYLGTVAFGLANGGTAGMIYIYVIVGVLFALTNISLAEMASMAPTAGGQYHWVSEFAPRRHQKVLSYFIGWLCVLGWQTGVAIGCFLAATQIQGLVVLNYDNYVFERWHGSVMTIAVVLVVFMFNTLLAKHLPVVEGVILFLHLAGFLAIIIPLWVMAEKTPSEIVWTEFSDEYGWGNLGLACLIGMLSPITSLLGADAAVHMSEELKNASKSVPRAMISTAVFNGLLGFVTVITFSYCVGDVQSVLNTKTGYPFIQVFLNTTGSKAGASVMTVIVIVLGMANGMTNMATASRQLFAFARDNGVPFSGWFMHVPKGWGIPLNSILFTALFASCLPLINIGSNVAFNQILSLGVCALLSSYIISISCVTARRLTGQALLDSHFSLGRWGLVVNVVSVAWLLVGFVMTFFPPGPSPTPDNMNWSVVIYVGVLAIGTVYYVVWARHVYVGPVEYVRKSD